jgi:hypothetical protein
MEVYNELLEKIRTLLAQLTRDMDKEVLGEIIENAGLKDFELKAFMESELHISDTSRRNYGDMVEKIEYETNKAFSDAEFYGKSIDKSLLEMELDLEEDYPDEPIVTGEK